MKLLLLVMVIILCVEAVHLKGAQEKIARAKEILDVLEDFEEDETNDAGLEERGIPHNADNLENTLKKISRDEEMIHVLKVLEEVADETNDAGLTDTLEEKEEEMLKKMLIETLEEKLQNNNLQEDERADDSKCVDDANNQPHIIIILADDLGYNDVEYNAVGSAVLTPKINELAQQGVKLGNYYVQPQCSPTRSQLLTGRYQIRTGLQHNVVDDIRPFCLPLAEKTMADKLKEAGYKTHLVGKWHVGFYAPECTPTYRGFDSFLGFYAEGIDYYNHTLEYESDTVNITGYDFRRGTAAAWSDYVDEYSTDIYTEEAKDIIQSHATNNPDEPMFLLMSHQSPHAPLEVEQNYRGIYKDSIMGFTGAPDRKTLAGMVSSLDASIGEIVQSLKDQGLYDNSVILFSSDNGAPTTKGNNWPLRGGKNTLFEGGLRTVGFVHSPLLSNCKYCATGTTSNALIHVSDWFPTLVSRLGKGNLNNLAGDLDGVDAWTAICNGTDLKRTEILHNIDRLKTKGSTDTVNTFDTSIHAALRKGDWKIITGDPGSDDDWTAPPESDISTVVSTDGADKRVWLFNIAEDPTEKEDKSGTETAKLQELLEDLKVYYQEAVTEIWPSRDSVNNPADGGVWGPWGTKDICLNAGNC